MVDDAASAACATKFAGDLETMIEAMSARIEGWAPRNKVNFDVNDSTPNQAASWIPP